MASAQVNRWLVQILDHGWHSVLISLQNRSHARDYRDKGDQKLVVSHLWFAMQSSEIKQ